MRYNQGSHISHLNTHLSNAISLIALIITIVVIIILAAVVIGSSLSTPEKANYAKFMSDMSEIQQYVSIARTENLIGSVNTSEPISKDTGFTKVIIKNAPGTFSSVDEGDNITGYIVNFDKLNINTPQGLTDTTGLTEVEFETDNLYIYDADGVVYRTKGYEENGAKYYAINDTGRPWDGKTKNTNWYDKNPSATEFYINAANEFARGFLSFFTGFSSGSSSSASDVSPLNPYSMALSSSSSLSLPASRSFFSFFFLLTGR